MQITPESTIVLVRNSAPLVKLDDKHYKLVDKMEALVDAPPSLVDATKLTVKGPVKFSKGVVIKGDVTLSNGELLTYNALIALQSCNKRLKTRHAYSS